VLRKPASTPFATNVSPGAALQAKNYKDAEPFLLDGYEGLKKSEAAIAPINRYVLSDAVDRLIELYAAKNNSVEVKKWRAERAKYPLEVAPMRGKRNDGASKMSASMTPSAAFRR
jgi:hypothetical protein